MSEEITARAWLYQYNPVAGAEWLNDLANNRRVDWRIARRSKETHAGDLVVFWESREKGGLRGWGWITEEPYFESRDGKDRWRVPLRAELWLERPIPRAQIRELLSPDNPFLRVSQGANFPLQPDEVAQILGVVGVATVEISAVVERIRPHSSSKRAAPLPEPPKPAPSPSAQTGLDLPPGFTPEQLTPAARLILQGADFRARGLTGPLSSTRLFLATFDPDKWAVHPEDSSPAEAAALRALRALVRSFRGVLHGARDTYLSEQSPGTARYSTTKNARTILEKARKSEFTQRSGGRLSADGIIASLLTTQEGRMLDHLEKTGLSLVALTDHFMTHMVPYGGSLKAIWIRALTGADQNGPDVLDGVGVARIGNDNAWNHDVKDSLGAEREARAFASLAISAQFVPPLAVGVFGDWGSGKSFFMRLVYEHIQELSKPDRSADHRSAGAGAELLADVVQIRFNAWHYVDTNLWASLVDHIFSELDRATSTLPQDEADKLFEQLTTARELTLASAERLMQRRKEHGDAAVFVADAQAKLQEKRQERSSIDRWAIAQRMFEEELGDEGNSELKRLAKELGVEDLVHTGKDLREAVIQLEGERRRAGLVARHAFSDLFTGSGFLSFLVLLALGSLATYVLREIAVSVFEDAAVRDAISQAVLGACGIVAGVVGIVRKAAGHVQRAVSFLKKRRDRFDQIAEDALKEPADLVKRRQEELARLSAEVAEGEARLKSSAQRVGEAAREYNAKTGRGRLLSFVRSRATGEDYAKHLGLVSTVRKDFEELSELVADSQSPGGKQKGERERELATHRRRVEALLQRAVSNAPGGIPLLHDEEQKQLRDSVQADQQIDDGPTVSRIVLYIDDLDRCKPEKVVEVLQAIHLLLSFRLFVVFVAVDVRWVTRALHKCYPQLLGDSAGRDVASAHDYLEKIFQVPYWVRPMNATSSAKFMSDRLELQKPSLPATPSMLQEVRPLVATEAPEVSPTPPPAIVEANRTQDAKGGTKDASGTSTGRPVDEELVEADFDLGDSAAQASGASAAGERSFRSSLLHVELTEPECAFMTQLACWAGNSPRRLIRFLNVYQVMKASLTEDDLSSRDDGEFVVLMAQAAIVTGAPSLVEGWHEHLSNAPDGASAADVTEQFMEIRIEFEESANLQSILSVVNARRPWTDAADLKKYCTLSRRFSFGAEHAAQADCQQGLGSAAKLGFPAAWPETA